MPRGEGKADVSKHGGLLGGAVLLTLGLGAALVVALAYREPEAPEVAPSLSARTSLEALSFRLCNINYGDPYLIGAIDTELARRGYVGVGAWSERSTIDSVDASTLEGCGIAVIATEDGSTLDTRDGVGCNRVVRSAATCGGEVRFRGTGEARTRLYRMAGITPEGTLDLEHRMAHAEAAYLLGPGNGSVLFMEEADGRSLSFGAEPSECARFVLVGFGTRAEAAGLVGAHEDPFLAGLAVCDTADTLRIYGEGSLSLRRFAPSLGPSAGGRMLPTVDTARIVHAPQEL